MWLGGTSSATATVTVPGGGQYRLAYALSGGGLPSSWEARIESVDGSFPAIVLESLADTTPAIDRPIEELPFTLPAGTAAIHLTFEARHLCSEPKGIRQHLTYALASFLQSFKLLLGRQPKLQ